MNEIAVFAHNLFQMKHGRHLAQAAYGLDTFVWYGDDLEFLLEVAEDEQITGIIVAVPEITLQEFATIRAFDIAKHNVAFLYPKLAKEYRYTYNLTKGTAA